VERKIDPVALEQFLSFDFVIGPRTMLHGVEKLPAGHYAEISACGMVVQPYWKLDFERREWNEEDAVARFDELMHRSVRLRLLGDVPLGLFLSGGLDSTTIAYYMRENGSTVRSYSIGFEEDGFDERRYAQFAARHLGTEHHVEVLSEDRVRDLLPHVTDILDEPMGDAAIFPTYLLSAFTRRHMKVALGGDGSDELLMGYDAEVPAEAADARANPRRDH
jgi:asparagine synthase (glutamine-hydrolysing)